MSGQGSAAAFQGKVVALPDELVGLPYVVDAATGVISLLAVVPVGRMVPRQPGVDVGKVHRYAAAMRWGSHFPPVDLFGPRWPGDDYDLFNGHHRRAAAIRAGVNRLLAWVTPVHRRPHDPPAWWASLRREEVDVTCLGPLWEERPTPVDSASRHERALRDLLLRHARSPKETPWEAVLHGVIQIAQEEGGLHPGWAEEMVWVGIPIPQHLPVGLRSRAQESVLRPGFAFRAALVGEGVLVWVAPTGNMWLQTEDGGLVQRGLRWVVVGQRVVEAEGEAWRGKPPVPVP